MGPSRHTRTLGAASAAESSSSRKDDSASALTATGPKTPTRPSPYTRTPTKATTSSALSLGPSTPTSRTNSPMMLREIFSMISPFRGLSRARRSAAFGGADETDVDQGSPAGTPLAQASNLDQVEEDVDADDRMIEDAEEGFSASTIPPAWSNTQRSQLSAQSDAQSATQLPSRTSRSSLAAPPKSLPLANDAFVTPGLRRQLAGTHSDAIASTPGPSTSYTPPTQSSPVSRNYDLLARFFSEKQRGGQGALTEVEVEGCIRLIEESMAHGRNLESEFAGDNIHTRAYPAVQRTGFAPSSRASSIAPPAFPSSQSMNILFHPGTNKMNASSSAYSFLAPRAPASQTGFGGATTSARSRRPIYVGPGMSSLSLNRRRPVVASASRATEMAKSQASGFMPRSSTDPNLARLARFADETQDASARTEEAKRRRTGNDIEKSYSSAEGRESISTHPVQFEPAYEKEARQSSLLARDVAASSSTNSTSTSPLKRAAPSATDSAAPAPSIKVSPPKVTTRTASAIQDILKTTAPVRPPTKPELINPYQSSAPLAAKSKPSAEADAAETRPVRRSARASMLTRAKARESAKAADKHTSPKESVLDLIERTAPKPIGKRKADNDVSRPERPEQTHAPEPVAPQTAGKSLEQERKLQKTEEVQRRLEALNKAKNQQQDNKAPQSSAAKSASENKSAKAPANLLPPQYTATKPKKPSPLSAAFQAPDSPSSDSETTGAASTHGPAIAQPNFSFGSAAASTPKISTLSSGFSFSTAEPASSPAPSTAASPSGTFSFSKPTAPATMSAPATAPAPAPSTSFSFSPVSVAPAPQQQSATISTPSSEFNLAGSSSSLAPVPNASASKKAGSVRSQVLAEDASKLPRFDWQIPTVATATNEGANQALRDEIESVAQAALPQFEFFYDIETSPSAREKEVVSDAPVKTPAASSGFSFSAPTQPSAAAPAPAPGAPAAGDSGSSDSTDDPSVPSSSGLLGEGEGEQSESTLFEVRAKIWRLDIPTKSWKDLGVCIAKIKHDSSTNKHRLLARNEANGKVMVNFMTYKGLKCTLEKTVNSFLGFEGQEPMQVRLKVKHEDMAREFKEVLEKAASK